MYLLIVYRIVNNQQHFYLVFRHWALHVQVPAFIRWQLISPVFWEEKLYSCSAVDAHKNTFFLLFTEKIKFSVSLYPFWYCQSTEIPYAWFSELWKLIGCCWLIPCSQGLLAPGRTRCCDLQSYRTDYDKV